MAYVTNAQVEARNPYHVINATSKPTDSTVDEWIADAENRLNGAFATIKLTVPLTSARGISIARLIILDYVEALVRLAFTPADGDDDAKEAKDKFDKVILNILDNPELWAAQVGDGTVPSSSQRLRSHVTNNDDGLTVANGDFTPEFSKGDVL